MYVVQELSSYLNDLTKKSEVVATLNQDMLKMAVI